MYSATGSTACITGALLRVPIFNKILLEPIIKPIYSFIGSQPIKSVITLVRTPLPDLDGYQKKGLEKSVDLPAFTEVFDHTGIFAANGALLNEYSARMKTSLDGPRAAIGIARAVEDTAP